LKKYSGWAIATVNEYTVCVLVHDGDLAVNPENLGQLILPLSVSKFELLSTGLRGYGMAVYWTGACSPEGLGGKPFDRS